jgi:hypothetical protein
VASDRSYRHPGIGQYRSQGGYFARAALILDQSTRAALIALTLLTVGKGTFYVAEWAIKRAAAPIVAQEQKRPAIRVVPTVTVIQKGSAEPSEVR